jgi:hypothetical protein
MQCPECGALLGAEAARGAARCEFCRRRSVAIDPSVAVPRAWFEPRVDRSRALLLLRRALRDEGVLGDSLRKDLEPVDARLVFVPFHLVRALRAGVVERRHERREVTVADLSPDGTVTLRTRKTGEERSSDRAKVIVTDVERSVPAVRRRDWGLDRVGVGALLAEGHPVLPYDADRIREHGTVLVHDVEPHDAIERLPSGGAADRVDRIAPSVRTVLVPVWRIRYRLQGCLYDATVDAVKGRLLAARAPEDDRRRVPIALGYVGVGALTLGLLLRLFRDMGAASAGDAGGLAAWFILPAAVVLGLFGAYAWSVVRWDADRVFDGASVRVRYVNRPDAPEADAAASEAADAIGRGIERLLPGGDRD